MSDGEDRGLERAAASGDQDAGRRLVETAIRAGRGWLLVWRPDLTEAPLAGEVEVRFTVGRKAGATHAAGAAWAGSPDELWARLESLRGRRGLLVNLAAGAAYPVGGRQFAVAVGPADAPPTSKTLPAELKSAIDDPDPPKEDPLQSMLEMLAQLRVLGAVPDSEPSSTSAAIADAVQEIARIVTSGAEAEPPGGG